MLSQRPGWGGERYEKTSFQAKVREMYAALQQQDDKWVVLDGTQAPDKIHSQIVSIAEEAIQAAQFQPLKRLWLSEKSNKL